MEYTVSKLAKLSGVSTRTLRYYDEIGLLNPCRVNSNGYRIYGSKEVDRLQQILFYRELGVNLDEIKLMLSSPDFDSEKALQGHLTELKNKKEQIERLIENVSRTISSMKGEIIMSDREKFEVFKQKEIQENEQKYGKEIREKYGVENVNASDNKIKNMNEEQYKYAEVLRAEIDKTLKSALKTQNPAGELAQKACSLHRQWICLFWKDGMYSKQAHKGLGEMYVQDERFKKYYDRIAEGAAEFLRDALNIYCAE